MAKKKGGNRLMVGTTDIDFEVTSSDRYAL
jgi:hypothetical protein